MILIFQDRWIPDLCDLSHVAGWKMCDLHDLACFLIWICAMQILHNVSYQQGFR